MRRKMLYTHTLESTDILEQAGLEVQDNFLKIKNVEIYLLLHVKFGGQELLMAWVDSK